jgi:hypothetical protein
MGYSMKRLLFAAVLKPVHRRLAQYVNWTRGMTGRRWQWRFSSCPSDDRHIATAIHYAKSNPVRADLVREAESYHWGMADSAEYVVNGGGAGCDSSSPAVRDSVVDTHPGSWREPRRRFLTTVARGMNLGRTDK